jgi:hypothetical protein
MPPRAHEDEFLPPSLSDQYQFVEETFDGARGNDREAPIPDDRADGRLRSGHLRRTFVHRSAAHAISLRHAFASLRSIGASHDLTNSTRIDGADLSR